MIPESYFQELKPLLQTVRSRDRYRLLKKYHQLEQFKRNENDEALALESEALRQALDRSLTWVASRRERLPTVVFPDELPVSQKRQAITEAIEGSQVVIIAGETGSGKTTQLPKICLDMGRGIQGLIGHTQPRRIAARSVANRIAEELATNLGDLVGYQVRFTDQVSESTLIKLMTDGILLAEIQRDPYLNHYDTLIIDEAHERSLNIDFLLGYLKQLLPKRPDLKLLITSATIDVEKFAHHFGAAPIIEVSGRTYPVEVRYRPPEETASDTIQDAIINCIHDIVTIDRRGDILVFLPGERDIREVALRLRRESIPHLSIVPLYARLSAAEQNKIFQPQPGQRVVLATNVAETSLTVPGIRYVIDPGYARISRYSFRTKVQRLPIEAISQASANQRKGRCGRVSEGVCFRLYSEQDFLSRPEFTDPEILRTNLAAVILQMAQLKLGDVREFPFVDKPDVRLINDGYKLLQELRAIDAQQKLTRDGRCIGQLPVDPQFGRMLLAADRLGCLKEIVTIVSALSIQDPRERPADKQQAADQKHREYWHEDSDFLAYLNLWQVFEEQRQSLSANQLQKWCRSRLLAYNRMREWRDIHNQITLAVKHLSLRWNEQPATYAAIHTALLSGLLGNIGYYDKETKSEYLGARNRRFGIFPASSQFKKTPQWVVAAELIETSKLFAHTVARVQTDWLLSMAQHLVKHSYLEPHYHSASGQVMAFEKTTLYGLVLTEKKRVSYGRLNPKESRELFIRAALVEGRYGDNRRMSTLLKKHQPDTHFFCWQQQLLADLQDLEAKSRRRDIVADDQVLFDFYQQRIPEQIINLDGFEHWRKQAEKNEPRLLFIDREQMMQHGANQVTGAMFPDSLELAGVRLAVTYHFDPAHRDDGVTLKVPVSALHLLSPERLEWLVPGFLPEKITAMIKALPKQWRKQFAPVPATVQQILPYCLPGNYPLSASVSQQLLKLKGIQVPDECWQKLSLDPYYSMNIHVLDETGKLVQRGRDLATLRKQFRDQVQGQLQRGGDNFEQTDLTSWSFGELKATHVLQQNGLEIPVYPGLAEEGGKVALKLFDDRLAATANSLRGMVRLALLSQPQTVKYLRKQLLKNKDLGLTLASMGDRDQVVDDILCATVRQTCFAGVDSAPSLIRQPDEFALAIEQGRSHWVERAEAIAGHLLRLLGLLVEIKSGIKQNRNQLALAYALPDIQRQLGELLYPGCLYDTPYEWLQQFERYFKAILMRLEKVPRQVVKDRALVDELEPLYQRYRQLRIDSGEAGTLLGKEVVLYRWMLEELRVSLFAQALGTRMPVSIKRLEKHWALIQDNRL